ncbi:MAG: YqjF family protein [Bacteroidota bacterium]|jgi:uncharacterized protein YqjF (DUF2071 family)
MNDTFLKAEWRKLLMSNYLVEPNVLKKYVPYKTELDLWNGNCYLSLVGFMFLNTKIKGVSIPFHKNFEEVNLRFYVRYNDSGLWKRGVVFIKEIVPKPALTMVANMFYQEHYETLPMRHLWEEQGAKISVCYEWKKHSWYKIAAIAENNLSVINTGSEEEFITEHYWGYTKINESKTSEYQVEHPKWEVYPVIDFSIDVDFAEVYGSDFDFLSIEKPKSVLLA